MGKHSKDKGNEAERGVARLILEAAGTPFDKTDCYRTPLSGGHPFADAGDLVVSPRLREVLPFTVEVKHDKTWRLHCVMEMTALFIAWMEQALRQEHDNRAGGRKMLLVVKGNFTGQYCVLSEETFQDYVCYAWLCNGKGLSFPALCFTFQERRYMMIQFHVFLQAVGAHSDQKRCK